MLTPEVLAIDAEAVSRTIAETLRSQVLGRLKRRGAVVGLSGGVDSSVVAALCARALGPERILGVFMPERDSSPESLRLGRLAAEALNIPTALEEITPALEGLGCYDRQREAIRAVFPGYGPGWRCKVTLPSVVERDRLSLFKLTVEDPAGQRQTARMPAEAYRQLVAATNFKQRVRKTLEYYHADRMGFAVAGTPNRLEYDQGFFVKQGDGAADVKPIAHLYKTQVYALARHLGVPEEIRLRPPTTDTWSLDQTQEEFFFALPWQRMDLCLWALEHGVAAADVAQAVDLSPVEVERVFRDIEAKRRATAFLHEPPLLIEAARPGPAGADEPRRGA